ncbi:unnamed protein product [Caenorhabditis brenneri]
MEKAANNAGEEAKVEIPPPIIVAQEKSEMEKLTIPAERERNIGERKNGYDYSIVVINYKPGLKFGLGIKKVYNDIFVIKKDENSLVTGLFSVADRIIDVDGTLVKDAQMFEKLVQLSLNKQRQASVLVERPLTFDALQAVIQFVKKGQYHHL